jgi:hypothetical protein
MKNNTFLYSQLTLSTIHLYAAPCYAAVSATRINTRWVNEGNEKITEANELKIIEECRYAKNTLSKTHCLLFLFIKLMLRNHAFLGTFAFMPNTY